MRSVVGMSAGAPHRPNGGGKDALAHTLAHAPGRSQGWRNQGMGCGAVRVNHQVDRGAACVRRHVDRSAACVRHHVHCSAALDECALQCNACTLSQLAPDWRLLALGVPATPLALPKLLLRCCLLNP